MTYEIIYRLRDGSDHVAKSNIKSEAEAIAFARKISNFPDDAVHYMITREDGYYVHDTRTAGLL